MREVLEAEFYAREFNVSYSSLTLLLSSPVQFYKDYVLKQKEIKDEKYFSKGKIIHYLMLDDGSFDDNFILATEGIPSDNTRDVINRVLATHYLEEGTGETLKDYSAVVIEILKEMKLHQALVDDKKPDKDGNQLTGDEKRLNKVIDEKSEEYFQFMLKKGNRQIIDANMLAECMATAEILKANKEICELLGLNLEGTDPNYGVYNELYHKMNAEWLPFGIHGILDNMVVDIAKKTVRVNDLKTTSKSISEFEESVHFYKYWIQAAIYKMLAADFLKDVLDETWKIEVRFIVVDKYNQCYPFRVSDESMMTWGANTHTALDQFAYHYTNREYSLPYEFLAGEVLL